MSKRPHPDARPCHNLDGFVVKRILKNDSKSKAVHVLGNFKDDKEDAIITMIKPAFSVESVSKILSGETVMTEEFVNECYGKFQFYTKTTLNSIDTQIIKPVTEKHIDSYTQRKPFLVYETEDMYNKITKPYLEKSYCSEQWIYDILEHKSESEEIIYDSGGDDESGFVLVPDKEWDTKDIEHLHVIGVVKNRNIRTIRDLNTSHLPLLKKLMGKGMETVSTKYDVPKTQIRAYFHYYPSYFHLHVHFCHLLYTASDVTVEKAHLIGDVVDNLEQISDDFYAKRTLSVIVLEKDPLLELFKEAGVL